MAHTQPMKTILCFGDSNTWAYIPGSESGRAPLKDRWPSVLEATLNAQVGEERAGEQRAYQVTAEGLNGRTTVFDDPFSPARSGIAALPMLLDTHAPLDLVIIMLGTNDTKNFFGVSAEQIGLGIERLADAVAVSEAGPVAGEEAASNPGAAVEAHGAGAGAGPIWPPARSQPKLLIVAPAPIGPLDERMHPHFAPEARAREVSRGLSAVYRTLAAEMGAAFFDAGMVVSPGSDGVHLDIAGQRALGAALAEEVRAVIGV